MQRESTFLSQNIDFVIHDMSFDWFGNRLAIVGDDRIIRVYSYEEDKWTKQYEFDSEHSGPVWKIKWTHPSFGNIISTCTLIRFLR